MVTNKFNKMKRSKLLFCIMSVVTLCACQSEKVVQKQLDYVTPVLTDTTSVVYYSQTNSIVNGQPFIPLGIYAVGVKDMPTVKDFGFNLVQSYQFFGMPDEEKKEYLDEAFRNGLMVFAGLNGAHKLAENTEKIKETVNTFKNHPALYAWYLADEPSIKSVDPNEFQALYDWIKQTDPDHPVINSNWELGNFKNACDADMRQLYQGVPYRLSPGLENYLAKENQNTKTWVAILNSYDSGWEGPGVTSPSLNPTSAFDKLAEKGVKKGDLEWKKEEERWQPLLDHLDNPEAAGLHTSASFPNTPEAVRGAFYWAFAHGSNGVYYWLYSDPKGTLNLRWGWYTLFFQPRLCAALKSTLAELKDLSIYLVNPYKDYTAFKDEKNPNMFVWSKLVDGKRIIIVLNETGEPVESELSLAPLGLLSEQLKVYREDERCVLLENGILKDSFKKDEAHVYFVEQENENVQK